MLFSRFFSRIKNSAHKGRRLDIKLIRGLSNRRVPTWTQLKALPKTLESGEKKILAYAALIGAAALGVWIVAAFARHTEFRPAVGGTFTEGVVGAPALINPLYASLNETDADIARLTYAGLLRVNDELALEPDLAESWNVSDDGKTYTLRLRENLQFHDNQPLTADDVLFTVSAIKDARASSPLRVAFAGIEAKKIDDRAVVFTLKEPFSPFAYALTTGILPAHLWQGVTAMQTAPLNRKPVGAGPYVFSGFTTDQQGNILTYTLARNTNFHRGAPHIAKIVFRFFVSRESALDALRTGKIDALRLASTDERANIKTNHLEAHTLSLPQYTALFFNPQNADLLKDLPLRSAMAASIDREGIKNDIIKNGEVIDTVILPGIDVPADIERHSFDLAAAKKMLDEKGYSAIDWNAYRELAIKERMIAWEEEKKKEWETAKTPTDERNRARDEARAAFSADIDQRKNPDQTAYRKKGDAPAHFTVSVVDNAQLATVADRIARAWRAIGIATEVEITDAGRIEREVIAPRAYEILLTSVILTGDPDPFPFWHSSQTRDPGLNLSLYGNRKVDTLLEQARAATSTSARIAKYQEFQKILARDLPALFLYRPMYLYAQRRVKGFTQDRIIQPADRLNNVEKWYLRRKLGWK